MVDVAADADPVVVEEPPRPTPAEVLDKAYRDMSGCADVPTSIDILIAGLVEALNVGSGPSDEQAKDPDFMRAYNDNAAARLFAARAALLTLVPNPANPSAKIAVARLLGAAITRGTSSVYVHGNDHAIVDVLRESLELPDDQKPAAVAAIRYAISAPGVLDIAAELATVQATRDQHAEDLAALQAEHDAKLAELAAAQKIANDQAAALAAKDAALATAATVGTAKDQQIEALTATVVAKDAVIAAKTAQLDAAKADPGVASGNGGGEFATP